jgi:hypothetical protein
MNRDALERVVHRAALLAGEGAGAAAVAHFVASAAVAGEGRACLDGGASLQLFLDAPGPPSFHFAVRVDDATASNASDLACGLADDDDARALADVARRVALPRSRSSFGAWLLRDEGGVTLVVDVRGVSAGAAAANIAAVLRPSARGRLDRYLSALDGAAPWGMTITASSGQVVAVHLRWSLLRGVHPARAARALASEASWNTARDVLALVLGELPSEHTRPWQIVSRLDDEGPLALATSAWARRLDLEAKRERLVAAFEALGGPWRQADATWRLLRQCVPGGRRWTIGRGLEVRADGSGEAHLRAVLVPAPDQAGGAMAGRMSSSSEATTGADAVGAPKRS